MKLAQIRDITLDSQGHVYILVKPGQGINGGAQTGGGIDNSAGSMLITESSITGNVASSNGGGIDNMADLVLRNVTVSGNRAQNGGGISGPGDTVAAINTIIADNVAPTGPSCSAAFRSEGYNLIDDLSDCSVLGETGSNIVGQEAKLKAMDLNSASTFSQTPLVDSRVIDSGSCRLDIDQRGMARPYGDGCDIGAIEYGSEDVVEPPARRIHLPMIMR